MGKGRVFQYFYLNVLLQRSNSLYVQLVAIRKPACIVTPMNTLTQVSNRQWRTVHHTTFVTWHTGFTQHSKGGGWVLLLLPLVYLTVCIGVLLFY